jgi:hypothetical protein
MDQSEIPYLLIILLTKEVREPCRLSIVFNGNTNGIEKHKSDHEPVEPLSLDGVLNSDPESSKVTIRKSSVKICTL